PRIFPHQTEQLTQGQHHQLVTVLFQSADIISYLWRGLEDGLFFGVSIAALKALSAWWAMGAERDALILFVGDALVGHDVTRIELDLDLVLGFPNLHATTDPGHRDGVAVAVQGHITFDIHRALVQTIDFGDPGGQRLQMPLLEGKPLARDGTCRRCTGGPAPTSALTNCRL